MRVDTQARHTGFLSGIALIFVLLLAGLLRFGWAGVSSFAFDEARLSLISLAMARGGQFAFLGMPSSVGVPNLPAAAWIFALPYALSPDPLLATLFAGLLSLLAVVGVWWLARDAWGGWAGIVAALFMAASPYSVLYARSIWAQNLLAPLAVLWGIAAYYAVTRRSRVALALNIFTAGFAFQVHFAAAALVIGSVYLFVRYRWWRQRVAVLVGGALPLLTLAPFVLHVACCAPAVAEQFGSALGGEAQVSLTSFEETARLALGWDWGYLAAGDWPLPAAPALTAALAAVILLAGGVTLLRALFLRTPAPPEASQPAQAGKGTILVEIALVWLLIAPLFFLRHSTPVFIHYQLTSLPALALIAGASTRLLARRWWPPLLTGLVGLLALLWAVQVGASLEEAGHVAHRDGLGTPLHITRGVAQNLPADRPVLFFTHGDDPLVDGEVAVFEALGWGRDQRIVQGETLLILPARPAYLLATLAPFQAWEEIEAAGLAQDVREYPRRRDEGPGYIGTAYDGEAAPEGFTLLDTPVRFANGAQIEGWKARLVGPRLRISTLWRVLDDPPPGTYQQFHHLRTEDTLAGDPFMVSDVPVTAHNWRVGDRLIVMADFFVDDYPPFWVDIGQYTLPDVQRIPRADGDGDHLRLGPFTIEAPE